MRTLSMSYDAQQARLSITTLQNAGTPNAHFVITVVEGTEAEEFLKSAYTQYREHFFKVEKDA